MIDAETTAGKNDEGDPAAARPRHRRSRRAAHAPRATAAAAAAAGPLLASALAGALRCLQWTSGGRALYKMDPDSVDKVGAANLTQFVMQHSGDKELAMMMSAVRYSCYGCSPPVPFVGPATRCGRSL